jgi:hypothetical protein
VSWTFGNRGSTLTSSFNKLGPALAKLGVQMDPPELTETFWIERG